MRKRQIKIIAIMMLCIVILFSVSMPVFASGITGDKIVNDGKSWIDKGSSISKIKADKIAPIIKPIANILLAIGSVLIVIIGVVVGIKYLTASPDQKGQLKGQLIGLFVSAVVLYGAYGIWSIVYGILKEVTG